MRASYFDKKNIANKKYMINTLDMCIVGDVGGK
jgi:hypothetical protein